MRKKVRGCCCCCANSLSTLQYKCASYKIYNKTSLPPHSDVDKNTLEDNQKIIIIESLPCSAFFEENQRESKDTVTARNEERGRSSNTGDTKKKETSAE